MSEEKNFDRWNELKKKIEDKKNEPGKYPKKGEVWMCSLGKNIGFEQNGSEDGFSRPVLIIKKFNNKIFWGIPLSTKQKKIDFYYNYTDPNGQEVSVILAQMKLISIKRLKRNLYEFDKNKLIEISSKLKSFL